MGNERSKMNGELLFSTDKKKNLQIHLSEEDYLPLPRSLRKSLIEGRRFQHVVPSRVIVKEVNTPITEKGEHSSENVGKSDSIIVTTKEDTEPSSPKARECSRKVVPIVRVVKPVEMEEKSKSLPSTFADDDKEMGNGMFHSPKRSPTVTNRKYSLIDLRTGLKKSRFTLELEDRLRQSKLELGFDTDLGWKEFNFKVESPRTDGRKRLSNEKGIQVRVGDESWVEQNLIECPMESVEYCTHNCQILGLCGVVRPQAFPKNNAFEPNIFREEMMSRYDLSTLKKTHSKKDKCPCDLCTLAYLTDMNCHDNRSPSISPKSGNSVFNRKNSGEMLKEKIKIVDKKDGRKSIEISVRNLSPDRDSLDVCSNQSQTTVDCTNSRIKRLFQENNFSDVKEIYNNANSTYNDHSVEKISSPVLFKPGYPATKLSSHSTKPKRASQISRHSSWNHRKSSSTTMKSSLTSSSSLSTVLSYRRVRQIFQTIIEGNRFRKRTKKNLQKFKEMEELGLGELKNNCWYPSDYKAFSIWKDMHSKQGFQAEFKKYHKTSPKIWD